jgi:hypothetical protein
MKSKWDTWKPSRAALDDLDPFRIEDDNVRAEILEFVKVFGGKLTLASASGRVPVELDAPRVGLSGEQQRRKENADKVFSEHRKLQAEKYAGLTVEQKEEIARQAERAQKEARRAWVEEQRRIQAAWAKWCRWREVAPVAADRYRRDHAGPDGDDTVWLTKFSSVRSMNGVQIPPRNVSRKTGKTATKTKRRETK